VSGTAPHRRLRLRRLRAPTCRPPLRGALLLAAILAGTGTFAAPASAKKPTAANWDGGEQRLVVREAVMGEAGTAGFAGAAPLSAASESAALAAVAARAGVAPIAFYPGAPITVVRFDALLVDQLGLGDVAEHVQRVAVAAGLQPPSWFGSEVVARYLDLRYEQPVGTQALDLYPWQPITRAEAAHSFAVVLGMLGPPRTPAQPEGGGATGQAPSEAGEVGQAEGAAAGSPPTSATQSPPGRAGSEIWALAAARETLMGFSLPTYTAAQREVLRIAVSKIGMPYVWGGTTDNTADGLEHGGYDCSGFAWRVYKVSGLRWGRQILGRTAAEQAGEIPKRERIRLQDVAPADLLFFGSARFDAKATNANVIHEGIALSSQWAIHSSAQGVYVLPLTSGWLAQSFVWARRVL
jgi:cell wall-associated NlpC family hydrolase